MLGWLVKRRLAAFERAFDYDTSYMQELYDVSPRAFWKYSKIAALSQHREDVPKEAWHAAKIVAALAEDCGPCTQLAVTMAERAGVSSETLRAILTEDQRAMSPDAALGFAFAKAVLHRDLPESDRLRGEVESRWGKRAVVSLALVIAATRVFPAVKYGLGYGRTCSRVRVAGTDVSVVKEPTHA
jgi:lambda repressor-like predicted transcriptional regulator